MLINLLCLPTLTCTTVKNEINKCDFQQKTHYGSSHGFYWTFTSTLLHYSKWMCRQLTTACVSCEKENNNKLIWKHMQDIKMELNSLNHYRELEVKEKPCRYRYAHTYNNNEKLWLKQHGTFTQRAHSCWK